MVSTGDHKLQPRDRGVMLGFNTIDFCSRRIYMKIEFTSQRREMLLFLTTNMAIPHLFERLFLISWENNRDCHITMPLSLKTMEEGTSEIRGLQRCRSTAPTWPSWRHVQTSNWPLQKIPYHTIMLFVCNPKISHKHCLQFLLGVKMATRESENNIYAKFWGDKQRALWYVMVFLEWSIVC